MEIIMRKFLVLIPVLFVVGCATTQNSEYVAVSDHKYNTVRYVKQDAAAQNAFVGTSATQPRSTFPRLHP
jgi:hypothetical protein